MHKPDDCTQCIMTPKLLPPRAFTIFSYTFCIQMVLSIAFILEMGSCSLVQDGQAERRKDIALEGSFLKLESFPQTNPERMCWLILLLQPISDSYTRSTAVKMKEEGFSSKSGSSPSLWPLAFGLRWVCGSEWAVGRNEAWGLNSPCRELTGTCCRWLCGGWEDCPQPAPHQAHCLFFKHRRWASAEDCLTVGPTRKWGQRAKDGDTQ